MDEILLKLPPLPKKVRGIKVTESLVIAAIEVLKEAPNHTLPQNSRKERIEKTPDGLDRRIKEKLKSDLMTACIISDLLAECGIVEVTKITNPATGRLVKATRLKAEFV